MATARPFRGVATRTGPCPADDTTVVYTAKVVEGAEETWSTDYDLWVAATDGSAPAAKLTTANRAWDAAPAFSPDGSKLAYLAMARPGYEADRFRVMVMDWPDGEARVITQGWDRSPRGIIWSPDGTSIYASADNIGNHSIFRIDPDDGSVQALLTRHTNSSPKPLPDGRLLFAQDRLTSPVELYVRPADGGEPLQITNFNTDRLATIEFGAYHQFSFIGAHGDEVFGYFIEPVNRDPGEEVPARVPHPRRSPGEFRRPLALPLEPGDLRRGRLRGGHDRFPRFHWVRPGLHRRHQRRLGRRPVSKIS